MEDRDGKKPFVIPKTHTSNNEIVITEKPDSRNVIELFNDIKSCALEAHFDFRQAFCKSCDTIRNQKLQKLYNEKRMKMKKDQDPIERFGFHLITYRDVALNVANNGVQCEQLFFPIEKYLGNPKDGIHLSRRPDVLLTSSGAQGLYRFGLLVCKILLGKGYATVPSIDNKQLSAQLHYDHHFCKIQAINKEQRHIDDLLANSLIFCYEHDNFEPKPQPSQILPIAILWYDLNEKFSPEFISTNVTKTASKKESVHHNGNNNSKKPPLKKKPSNQSTKSIPSHSNKSIIPLSTLNSINRQDSSQDKYTTEIISNSNPHEFVALSQTKYPHHLLVPYNRLHSKPSLSISPNADQQQQHTTTIQQTTNIRDPRLLRTKHESSLTSLETIPLSQQNFTYERSSSSGSLSINSTKSSLDNPLLITKSSSLIKIPLNSSTSLSDPRLKTVKNTRNIFYLELQAVKHALQQQKRLNTYYDSKTDLTSKTNYTVIPYLTRQVSNDEYVRLLNDDSNTHKFHRHSNGIDYSLLNVSVIDCLNFGLVTSTINNHICIDLDKIENKLASEQIEMSNDLIQREKQINSQYIRLRLREKRQRKIQQQINERKNQDKASRTSPLPLPNSKLYLTTGRQLLKEHKPTTKSANTHVPSDLIDFFSREYKNETRPHVKHILAEIVGIFIEKYHNELNQKEQTKEQNEEKNHIATNESMTDDQTINFVIDMDIESPSSQGLYDHDERFRVPTPPPPPPPPPPTIPSIPETIFTQPLTSFIFNHTLSNESSEIFENIHYNALCQKSIGEFSEQYQPNDIVLPDSNAIKMSESELIPSEETVFKTCLGQFESSSSSENNSMVDNHSLPINKNIQQAENIPLSIIENCSINTTNDPSRSFDELVRLLTQEAYTSKSTSSIKNQNNNNRSYNHRHQREQQQRRRRSFELNDNKTKKSLSNRFNSRRLHSPPSNNRTRRSKSPHKKVSSTRVVTLTSNHSKVLHENQKKKRKAGLGEEDDQQDVRNEPTVKRIKIDQNSSTSTTTIKIQNSTETIEKDVGLKSIVTVPSINNDHNHRHDLQERQRPASSTPSTVDNTKRKSSHTRSKSKEKSPRSSTNSRSSPIKNSKVISKSNTDVKSSLKSSQRLSSNNHNRREPIETRDVKHPRERRRSPDLSNHKHKRYSNQSTDRLDLFNEISHRNTVSSTYRQRNINDLIPLNHVNNFQQQQPSSHKRFNYNHQSVADHPRFTNPNLLVNSVPLMDFHYSKSSTHNRSISPITNQDRNFNSSYYQHNSFDRFDSTRTRLVDFKSSDTIERLQKILENNPNGLFHN
ncbi:unnamed protein product [Rotaria socialis]|uniref:DUF3715 domain-containing protein n=1 Tax=Rotaria socialis TaxID=392032 RepID=A0A821IBM5_9BILA|nr:unnamed protein product [Rotaria socialis]